MKLGAKLHGPLGLLPVTMLAVTAMLVVLVASAVACEGTGGPSSSPPASETVVTNPGDPGIQACYLGKSVNCASGNETAQQTDIAIGGRGPGLRIVRSYNASSASQAKEPGPWGYGWTGSYDASIEVGSETVTVHQDNGSAVIFQKDGSGYAQSGWTQARLSKSGSSYIYTLPNQTKLEFNSEDRLVKETERNANSNTFTYNASKQLEKVEDGDKRTLTFKYNGEGLVESIKDPMGHTVSYTYVEKQLASVTIEGKVRWKYEYGSPHLLKKVTDGRGYAVTIKYESSSPYRVIEEEIAGHKRKWEYKTSETKITEPNGSETLETFNSADEPTKIIHAKGKSEETTDEYEYSGETLNTTRFLDGNKHEWKYGYDSEENKTSETDPTKDERKWTYDKKHDIETETTPEGETTTYKLNSNGLPEVVERPVGSETQKTEYKYDAKGDVEEVINPLGHATKYTYDSAGDKETEKDPENNERKWKYNEDSQITEETSPRAYTTVTTRNEQGWPTKIENPLKYTTEYKYDGDGNIEEETDRNGHTTKYEYNEENLRTKVTEPNGDTTETGYDSEGQMTSHTDGNKHTWEYKRNSLEQVTEEKNPLGKIWKKKYEKAGNLESVEDPEGHTTEYRYDNSNRLADIYYSTGDPLGASFEYNKDGKVTKMTDEDGTTENTWDKLDLLTEYKDGIGKTVKYKYNLEDLPTGITYPNGKEVKREYDKDGRFTKVTDWYGRATTFAYNADSQLISTTFPEGLFFKTEYAYNEADQMTEVVMRPYSSEGATKLSYELDGDGQVTKTTLTNTGGVDIPGPEVSEDKYDANNRVTEAEGKEYRYDKANNPEEIAGVSGYTYNDADELEKGGGNTYAYNDEGQRTEAKPEDGAPTTTLTYNQAGDLTSFEHEGEATRGIPQVDDKYTYDSNNLLEVIKGAEFDGNTFDLTWDTAEQLPTFLAWEDLEEFGKEGVIGGYYIYGPENLPIELMLRPNEELDTLSIQHDRKGSIRLMGTNLGGHSFEPYGRPTENDWGFTPLTYDAQYTSVETELIYLRGRWYDPDTAQFISVDPSLASTGEPYTYARDNPENRSDPTGECAGSTRVSREGLSYAVSGYKETSGPCECGTSTVPTTKEDSHNSEPSWRAIPSLPDGYGVNRPANPEDPAS